MRYSRLFGKTNKNAPHDADSANARYLVQAGFADQLSSGIYTYLPLGLRVLDKVKGIVREEMTKLGAQEVLMPALQPSEPWEVTGRWEDPGPEVMFQFEGRSGKKFGLGWTHEEIVTPLAQKFLKSYKDLPMSVFQIQDKFRNEPRAKSGLLRGREFSMKDLYSFHLTEADLEAFYAKAAQAYHRVFERCGLDALYVEASGGAFSKYSHEFQVPTESGEDTVFACGKCKYAQNKEIAEMKAGDACPKCGGTVTELKAIEVGNIFQLKSRFTDAFKFDVAGEDGKPVRVLMGCYGIGPSRVMGTVAEVHHDDKGIIWPKAVAPFQAHVVSLSAKSAEDQEKVWGAAEALVQQLEDEGIEVLWDDRVGVSAGEKFADADLIGIPLRLIVSPKTLAESAVEWKLRHEGGSRLVKMDDVVEETKSFVEEV
jgi:prolyl-tRNA synthetase